MPPTPRYESLDFWRGLACLAVVVFHTTSGYVVTPEWESRVRADGGSAAEWVLVGTSRLWVGVPVFFVVSGYCIAAAADAARRRPWPGARFAARRAWRIYPPLWAYFALTAAAVAVMPPSALPGPTAGYPHPLPYPQDVPLGQWVGSLTLTEEWRPYVGGPPRGYFTGQVWTLCYEEQFYLVVGLIVAAARRWLFPAVALVTAAVFLNITDITPVAGPEVGDWWNAHRRPLAGCFVNGLWLAFAAGVGVYYRLTYATPVVRWCLDGLLGAGLLWVGRAVPSAWDFRPNLTGYLVVAFGFALLLGWLRPADRRLAGASAAAPAAWCGRMCYSLYLVHAPVTALVQWNLVRSGFDAPAAALLVVVPAGVAASVLLGWGFHRAVEVRFLNTPGAANNRLKHF